MVCLLLVIVVDVFSQLHVALMLFCVIVSFVMKLIFTIILLYAFNAATLSCHCASFLQLFKCFYSLHNIYS